MMMKNKQKVSQNGTEPTRDELYKAGYLAEKWGEPYEEDMPEAWKEGYQDSYKNFLEYGKGLIPQ